MDYSDIKQTKDDCIGMVSSVITAAICHDKQFTKDRLRKWTRDIEISADPMSDYVIYGWRQEENFWRAVEYVQNNFEIKSK